ncbi:hypothetical protein [Gloeothece verrucosa]|uniref:Uncharacterized protein n=1 Tax=Gloeothece verrucosa (strain PCC 7822) TaxID=497965 RepID=E0U8T7_GLOV7|nr:hypothetical protein [Gloeothece verrucosa]ADN14951.1 hypothetical protein Cyan7822_2994 [Gloeothece verrucosa PCC 7822]
MNNINPSLISSNPFLDLPYRLRYQASFQGSPGELLMVIKKLLDELEVKYIDAVQENYFNPAYERYELE